MVLAVDAPERPAVVAAQGDEERIALAVAVHDDLVLVEHRLVAEAPLAGVRARAHQPELLAVGRIVGGHDDLVAHAEVDVDPLAVGGRRARGVAVLAVDLLQRPVDDGLLPEDLARGAVEAEQHALPLLRAGGDGEDAVAPDDGRGVARAGHLGLPRGLRDVPLVSARPFRGTCRRRAARASRASPRRAAGNVRR